MNFQSDFGPNPMIPLVHIYHALDAGYVRRLINVGDARQCRTSGNRISFALALASSRPIHWRASKGEDVACRGLIAHQNISLLRRGVGHFSLQNVDDPPWIRLVEVHRRFRLEFLNGLHNGRYLLEVVSYR